MGNSVTVTLPSGAKYQYDKDTKQILSACDKNGKAYKDVSTFIQNEKVYVKDGKAYKYDAGKYTEMIKQRAQEVANKLFEAIDGARVVGTVAKTINHVDTAQKKIRATVRTAAKNGYESAKASIKSAYHNTVAGGQRLLKSFVSWATS